MLQTIVLKKIYVSTIGIAHYPWLIRLKLFNTDVTYAWTDIFFCIENVIMYFDLVSRPSDELFKKIMECDDEDDGLTEVDTSCDPVQSNITC